jgi:5-methylcytosine-specific restriction endonuclease McrA
MSVCEVRSCKRRAHDGLCKTHRTQRADREFSILIRTRDGACRRCQSTERLQCAHVHSRRYRKIRWDERNAMALCSSCHVWQTHHPLEGEEFFRSVLGDDVFDELRMTAIGKFVPPTRSEEL